MGCSRAAINDDETDWSRLRNKLGIKDAPWQVYSQEAQWAKEVYKELGITGQLLILAVGFKAKIREHRRNIEDCEAQISALAAIHYSYLNSV